MKTLRAVIVEDEPLARDKLRRCLERETDIAIVAECDDGLEAVAAIRSHRPHIVFLDVRLAEMDGFDVLRALGQDAPPAVIFVTAFDGYAARAFESQAADYLLKPFSAERFREALERARARIRDQVPQTELLQKVSEHLRQRAKNAATISLRSGRRILLVARHDIEAVVAGRDGCAIHTPTETHQTQRTLVELEAELDGRQFIRVNRSTLVNSRLVREIIHKSHGDCLVCLQGGKVFLCSRRYRASLAALEE